MPHPPFIPISLFRRKSNRLLRYVLLVGFGGSLIGVLYLQALSILASYVGPGTRTAGFHLVVLPLIGFAVAVLIKRFGPPGDVELLVDNIHLLGGTKEYRNLRSLIPVSLLCIAAGGAAGPEAPLVQTTGSLGTWIASKKKFSKSDLRTLTIAGMAAGFTVLFGAPLGATIFALEILHHNGLEYYEALLPATIGALCGYAGFAVATQIDLAPVWHFPDQTAIHRIDLFWAVVAGAVASFLAMMFTYTNIAFRRFFQSFPALFRPAVGGLILGALALWSPYALGFGEWQMDHLAVPHLALGAFAVAATAKFIGTSVTISSGWRGGFIIPLFFIGMNLGRLGSGYLPGTNEVVLMAALMAALNTGVTKTPIGSTLVVTEMAGLHLLPTTLLASVVALLLTSEVRLIASQRRRDDLAV